MAIERNDPTPTPRSYQAFADHHPAVRQQLAENAPPASADIVKALKPQDGPREMITRPVLKDDQLAGTDPDKMTLEEAVRLSKMQAERRAKLGGPTMR